MYAKILNEISQQYYIDNYPNEGQRFVAWYLRNIHLLDTIVSMTGQCLNMAYETFFLEIREGGKIFSPQN